MGEIYRLAKFAFGPQISYYETLEYAKKMADEYQCNVYNSRGEHVYTGQEPEQKFRIRKTWEDLTSQKGAYKDLTNAIIACDKFPGYSVFNYSGKIMYTAKKEVTNE